MPLAHQQGGSEALLMHLLRQGSGRFRYTCFFLQPGPMVDEARALGYRAAVFPTTHLRDVANYSSAVRRIRTWIKQEGLAAVLSWMPKAHLYTAPAALRLGLVTLWFQHGISHRGAMDRITTLLPATRVVCCSAAARAAQDMLFPRRPSAVCYPGVNLPPADAVSRGEARRRLGLDPGRAVLGMVARLERWKGAHVFLQAARIASASIDATFFIVGGPHAMDMAYSVELQKMAEQSGMGDRLILAGQRPSAEVSLWQAAADLIVHPVTGTEPFGMAVVEAMSHGRVVIASRAGGLTEIIEENISGFLVKPGDADALAGAIVHTLQQPEVLDRVGAAARLRAQSFSVERMAARMDELLAETLAGGA